MKKLSVITIIVGLFSAQAFAGYMINHPTKIDNGTNGMIDRKDPSVTILTDREYSQSPTRQAVINSSYNKAEIKRVQVALKNRGYKVGNVDGIMGKKTKDSLMTFQANESLEINGELNQDTLNSLGIYSDPNEVYSE